MESNSDAPGQWFCRALDENRGYAPHYATQAQEARQLTIRTVAGSGLVGLTMIISACSGSASPRTPFAPSALPTAPVVAVPPAPSGWVYGMGYTLRGVGLAGVAFEATATGQLPIEGVTVYCDVCGEFGHTAAKTDRNGYYNFNRDIATGGGMWLSNGLTALHVSKDGYQDPPGLPPVTLGVQNPSGWRQIAILGDTQFDIQLVRR